MMRLTSRSSFLLHPFTGHLDSSWVWLLFLLRLEDLDPRLGPVRLMWLITALLAVEAQADEVEALTAIIRGVREQPAERLLAALTTV